MQKKRLNGVTVPIVCASVSLGTTLVAQGLSLSHAESKAAVVLTVGCAAKTAQPHIWRLTHVADPTEASQAGITADDKVRLATRPPGQRVYELIGVADFVDADSSRAIGQRGEILSRSRVNSTGMLVTGHKVAVKGLYVDGVQPRINLTSVVDLGEPCPAAAFQAASAADSTRSVWAGVFADAQEKRGEAIYARECSTCHGERLKGGEGAPPLTGSEFLAGWNNQTLADLFQKIRQTMPAPPEQPGKLTPQQNADVLAHILSVNGVPAGATELPADVDLLKRVRIEAQRP